MLKDNNTGQFSFQFIFIMLLFLLIAILSLMIILLGKDIYTEINNDRAENYQRRVSLSYIANKIRQSDKENSIRIDTIDGENAIVINEVYDGEEYETWIYYYNNGIYEMFKDKDMEFNIEDGIRIMDIESFEIKKYENNLYKFIASDNKKTSELILTIYSD